MYKFKLSTGTELFVATDDYAPNPRDEEYRQTQFFVYNPDEIEGDERLTPEEIEVRIKNAVAVNDWVMPVYVTKAEDRLKFSLQPFEGQKPEDNCGIMTHPAGITRDKAEERALFELDWYARWLNNEMYYAWTDGHNAESMKEDEWLETSISFEADNDLEAVKYAAEMMLTNKERKELLETLSQENKSVRTRSR